MKQPAYILTILMLFFMVQPFVVNCQAQVKPVSKMTGCCGGESCHKKEKDKKTESKDCDRTNACNPFAGCSGCQYVAGSKFLYSSINIQTRLKKITLASENISSGFSSDCFQPPELSFV